jgi:pantothenate kinase
MLIFDIGPAYIKSAIILSKESELKEYLSKELEANKEKFEYMVTNLTVDYKNKILFFFKINLFRLEAFKSSYDYEVIRILLAKLNQCEESKQNYYCGHINEKVEKVLNELFLRECIKIGHVNKLSLLGLEYIAEKIPYSFYDIPGQSIFDLVQVGHKLNEVTKKNYVSLKDNLFPILFANIIEGTSVYKAESVDNFTRIGGTSFGATTYWSLVSLTCGYDDPEKAVRDAIKGNNTLIDLSVGDIYGGTYETFNLNSNLIASSFGKLKNVEDVGEVKKEDISRSLLTLFCVITSQITAMLATTSNVNKVIILGNPFECLEFMQMVQMVTNYFSGDKVNAYFSDYSPYINLIGMCCQFELDGIQFENI